MSSPKQTLRADARRNRARVLAAAQEAFADEGPAVPLDEIARRAGVGAGTVYRHFPSKESLFEAVVLDGIERLAEQAQSLLDAADPGAAFFGYFDLVVAQALLNKALCDALQATTGSALEAPSEQKDRFRAGFGELLRRAQTAGVVRPDVQPGDLTALLSGYLAIQRLSPPGRPLSRILTDGLRLGPAM
jgi:AcrR family transcriptional regulator